MEFKSNRANAVAPNVRTTGKILGEDRQSLGVNKNAKQTELLHWKRRGVFFTCDLKTLCVHEVL